MLCKNFIKILVIFVVLSFCVISVYALEIGGIPVSKEVEVPEKLNFKVSDTQAKYDYFLQAIAHEDGWFVICTNLSNTKDQYIVDYEKKYIDIYDADGVFRQELSFVSSQNFVIELTESTVNIFFYDSVLIYNFEKQDLKYYTIPVGVTKEYEKSGIYSYHEKEFISGEWTYKCYESTATIGYNKLTRQNRDNMQKLVDIGDTGHEFYVYVITSVSIALVGVLSIVWWKKRCEFKEKAKQSSLPWEI